MIDAAVIPSKAPGSPDLLDLSRGCFSPWTRCPWLQSPAPAGISVTTSGITVSLPGSLYTHWNIPIRCLCQSLTISFRTPPFPPGPLYPFQDPSIPSRTSPFPAGALYAFQDPTIPTRTPLSLPGPHHSHWIPTIPKSVSLIADVIPKMSLQPLPHMDPQFWIYPFIPLKVLPEAAWPLWKGWSSL